MKLTQSPIDNRIIFDFEGETIDCSEIRNTDGCISDLFNREKVIVINGEWDFKKREIKNEKNIQKL